MTLDPDTRRDRQRLVTEEYGGILPFYEAFYIESIAYTAGRASDAFQRFAIAKNQQENAEVVATVQEALAHTAALSRFFWPSKKHPLMTARAKKLQKAFKLEDNSPLKSRNLRNALEHFDEHLDEFLLEDIAGTFFPRPLVNDSSSLQENLSHVFRLVDPEKEIFVLLGERYDFGQLRKTVEHILETALKMARWGHRLENPAHCNYPRSKDGR